VRESDLVARFGGDEFVLLLAGAENPACGDGSCQQAAGRHQCEPLPVPKPRLISVTPSIGIALFPEHGGTPAELIKHADTAMYHAKSGGRARCRLLRARDGRHRLGRTGDGKPADPGRARWRVRARVPAPAGAAATTASMGVEALVRWNHPERGLVAPDEFIPVAEARLLILPISHWVLQQALGSAVRWQQTGAVRRAGGREPVQPAVSGAGLCGDGRRRRWPQPARPATMLELELTERMLMDDLPAVQTALHRLKAIGVHIAVDDFGTGYSSLGALEGPAAGPPEDRPQLRAGSAG
jgi:predicted signal transduction protein with EAL and GGDEF domain